MNARRVIFAVLLVTGCKPAESACERLAKQFCADGSLDCGVASATLAAAKLPEAACVEGLESMELLKTVSPDMRGYVKQAVLQELMKQSPMMSAEQLAGITKDARGKAEANAAIDDPIGPVFVGYEVPEEKAAPAPAPAPAP